jgi:hypothetical protein
MRILVILCFLFTASCSTRQNLNSEYNLSLKYDGANLTNRTVIVFLVDGLPFSLLQKNLERGRLPNLKNFYLSGGRDLLKARSGFPSLTFPSISSLLTRSPVSSHQIYSNTLIHEEERIFFEKPDYYSKLNELLQGKTIFSEFKAAGKRSVSLSYPFYGDVSAHIGRNDSKSAISILDKNYKYVDHKIIDALKILLEKNKPQDWPDFVFVHLIGLDFTNHDQTSLSKSSEAYLKFIDQQLKPVFELLEKQKSKNIVSLFTSDHGHMSVKKTFDLETALIRDHADVKVLNEGRYASLFFGQSVGKEQRHRLAGKYSNAPGVETTVVAFADHFTVRTKGQSVTFYTSTQATGCHFKSMAVSLDQKTWYCPEALPQSWQNLFYPYFISNMTYYLQTNVRPDLVLIPESGWSFHSKYVGQHGGPTAEEVIVPLLLRGASISNTNHVPALWEILGFL